MKKAFTLYETIIVLVVIGIMAAILMSNLRPNDIEKGALQKAAKAMYLQVEYATMQIITGNTRNGRLDEIVNGSNTISIASSSNQATLVNTFYKKYIKGLRSTSFPSGYTTNVLVDNAGTKPNNSLKISSFTGFQAKNDSYFGVMLHNKCTQSESYLYHPAIPSKTTQSNSCGLIFMDANGPKPPNVLGTDQFLVSLTLDGVR